VIYASGTGTLASGSGLTWNGAQTLTVDGGTQGYIVGPTGEFLIGEDASGVYVGNGNGSVFPAIPIYYGSTNTSSHRWAAAGSSELMRLTSTGLGIGTSSPSTNLQIGSGTGNGLGIFLSKGAVANFLEVYDGTKTFIAGTDAANAFVKVGSLSAHPVHLVAANGASNAYLHLSTSGNLGLGVTPAAWSTKALQIGATTGLENNSDAALYLRYNSYRNAGVNVFTTAATAAFFGMEGSVFRWYQSTATPVIGNDIVASNPMTLDASGNLVVGATTAAARIVSVGSNATVYKALILRNSNGSDGSSATIDFETSAGTQGDEASMAGRIAGLRTGSGTSGALTFSTTNAGVLGERARIDSSGNVGIGTSSPGAGIGFTSDLRILGIAGSGAASASSVGAVMFQNNRATPAANDTIGYLTFLSTNNTLPLKIEIYGQLKGSGGGTGGFGADLVFASRGDNNAVTDERLRITSDGYLRMASGSGGIQFNGDTAAANALDDYEEGTWTPTPQGSTGTAGTVAFTSSGTYTKVGNLVRVAARIDMSDVGSWTGLLQITGLPFQAAATAQDHHGTFRNANYTFGASVAYYTARIPSGSSYVDGVGVVNNGAVVLTAYAGLSATSVLIIDMVYST
jgi:hypothetical protein